MLRCTNVSIRSSFSQSRLHEFTANVRQATLKEEEPVFYRKERISNTALGAALSRARRTTAQR